MLDTTFILAAALQLTRHLNALRNAEPISGPPPVGTSGTRAKQAREY